MELGELDLGLRAFLTKAEAEEDSEEEREQGHHDVTMVTSAPGPLGGGHHSSVYLSCLRPVYRCVASEKGISIFKCISLEHILIFFSQNFNDILFYGNEVIQSFCKMGMNVNIVIKGF